MIFKYVFWGVCAVSLYAHGMPIQEDISAIKSSISSGELEVQRDENRKRESFLKKEIAHKAALLTKIQNSSSAPVYFWEDESHKGKNRTSVEKILKSAIRRHVDEITRIQQLNTEINGQLEWMNHQSPQKDARLLSEINQDPSTISANQLKSGCADVPVSFGSFSDKALIQDFGTKKDSLTGLEWNSLGWWIAQKPTSNIRACLKGKVVFSGPMQGRGYVVMIDHGDDFLTIYANLIQNGLVPKLGMSVKTGEFIGNSQDSLYFEVRHKGKSLNPRLVFARQNLDILGL